VNHWVSIFSATDWPVQQLDVVLVDEVGQELLEHISGILQIAL
jgi:hypothetical protein